MIEFSLNIYLRRRLRGEIQPGLKFHSERRARIFLWLHREFQAGLKLKTTRGRHFFVSFKTPSLRIPKLTFQPGLKFEFDYITFFSPFARAEMFSPAWNSLYVMSFYEDFVWKESWNLNTIDSEWVFQSFGAFLNSDKRQRINSLARRTVFFNIKICRISEDVYR